MSNALRILPECYGDTVLVEHLGFKRPNHQTSGIGQVAKIMSEKLKTSLAVGVIDQDKKIEAKYYQEFEKEEEKDGIIKMKHRSRKHYFLTHLPLEQFLLEEADKANVAPSKYGFKNLKALKKITKSIHIGKNDNFKQFLNTLKQKEAPGLIRLKVWLEEIVGESY